MPCLSLLHGFCLLIKNLVKMCVCLYMCLSISSSPTVIFCIHSRHNLMCLLTTTQRRHRVHLNTTSWQDTQNWLTNTELVWSAITCKKKINIQILWGNLSTSKLTRHVMLMLHFNYLIIWIAIMGDFTINKDENQGFWTYMK